MLTNLYTRLVAACSYGLLFAANPKMCRQLKVWIAHGLRKQVHPKAVCFSIGCGMSRRAAKSQICQPYCIFLAASLKIRAQLEASGSRKHEIPIFALLLKQNIISAAVLTADFDKSDTTYFQTYYNCNNL